VGSGETATMSTNFDLQEGLTRRHRGACATLDALSRKIQMKPRINADKNRSTQNRLLHRGFTKRWVVAIRRYCLPVCVHQPAPRPACSLAARERAGRSAATSYVLLSTFYVLLSLLSASAVQTNTWNMATNSDYYISPTNQPYITIDETNGVAKLILLSDQIHHSTVGEYQTIGASNVYTRLGPDSTIALKSSGGVYPSQGTFLSRVFDGGYANSWQKLCSRAPYGPIVGSASEIPTGADGPVVLYHLNTGWNDSVGSRNLVPKSGATLVSPGIIGSQCGIFNGGAAGYASGSSGLPELSKITVVMWVKLTRFSGQVVQYLFSLGSMNFSLYFSRSLSDASVSVGSIAVYAAPYASGSMGNQITADDIGVWRHIAVVYDAMASEKTRIYKDGLELSMKSQGIIGNIPATGGIVLGARDDLYSPTACSIDEVAIYDRALSSEEIINLYGRRLSYCFQLRSGGSAEAVTNDTNRFTGPDGTTNSYYFGENRILQTAGSFDVTNQFAQYKAYFLKDSSGITPWIDAVALFGDAGFDYDCSFLDFQLGSFETNTTNYPAVSGTPYLGMGKKQNGGYYTNGTYLSRIFDAGQSSASWRKLEWEGPGELTIDIPGLIALYHLATDWVDTADVVGGNNQPTAVTLPSDAWSAVPKLGTGCCMFDGIGSHVTGFPGLSANIMSVEFWINNSNAQDGIMTFGTYAGGAAYLAISNGFVIASGFPNTVPLIYVNGQTGSRKLTAGWNHVAVTMDRVLTGAALDVGVANGDYMQGLMDEMAIYTRQVSGTEIKSHYLLGRQNAGGSSRAAVRCSDSIAVLTGMVWSADYPASPYSFNTNGQYFQYRMVIDGDGSVSPEVKNITVSYQTPGLQFMYDNNQAAVYQGTFVNDTTRWYGDEIMLTDQSQWGPVNLSSESGLASGWHLDEESWGTVVDSVGGKNGTALGGAQTTADSKVGLRCGVFNGVSQYLTLGAPTVGSGDFTVGAWVRSSSTNKCAVVSTFSGGQHYTIEFNSDGVSRVSGRAAFVINDGVNGARIAASVMSDLNDNRWHHIAGARNGSIIHLFVDGDRVASASIGSSYGSVGSGTPYVAKYGTSNVFFNGYVDEVVVYQKALSDAEAGELSGAAYKTRDQGIYTSEVLDAKRSAIWRWLAWGADAPYSKALTTEDTTLVGLWHMDGDGTDSANSNDDDLTGTKGWSAVGRFGACLSLSGVNQWMNISAVDVLKPAVLTIEAWVYLNRVESKIIVDKIDGSNRGYRLGTDGAGRPYFRAGNLTCSDPCLSLQKGQWMHLAGTYTPGQLTLYVNGEVRAVLSGADTVVCDADLRIGADLSGGGCVDGNIDEVALHDRRLMPVEILDHYRSGAVSLKLQARSSGDPVSILTMPWRGPSGSNGTYYTISSGEDLMSSIDQAQYFQYRAYLSTENHRFTPRLQGVRVDASSYSTNSPNVDVAVGVYFPGKLTMFSHTLSNCVDASIRYQVSGDNGATWYFWPSFTNIWLNAEPYGGGYDYANPVSTINANIASFYKQLYEKSGITNKWRAFLHSAGRDPVALDSVSIAYSSGRIVLTAPNGTETNKDAWLIGTTNTIRWTRGGTVEGTVRLDYSLDSGTNWVPITNGYPASADSLKWVTPGNESTHCQMRIISESAPTEIWDISDGEFELVRRYRIVHHNGGPPTWYIGDTNLVVWGGAQLLGTVNLDYSGDDTWTNPVRVASSKSSAGGNMSNTFAWVTQATNAALPSETARLRVQTPGGQFTDYSDNFFTMAGVAITQPGMSVPGVVPKVKKDAAYDIVWKSAGCSNVVRIELQSKIGESWSLIDGYVTNYTGWNSYSWYVTNSPTEEGKIRITSLSDPRAYGESVQFILAAIDVTEPRGDPDSLKSEKWLVNSTQTVRWVSAGATNFVNLRFSTDSGSNWMPVALHYTNSNVAGVTNQYTWVVSNLPSASARIKVEDYANPADLSSMSKYNFHVAGVRVLWPNGPVSQEWIKGTDGIIRWDEDAVGADGFVEISYDEGSNWVNIAGSPGAAVSLIDKAAPPFKPTIPSVRSLVRVTPQDPSPFTNVFDQSDSYFAVAGVLVENPTNAAAWMLGGTNEIRYLAAATHAPGFLSDIYYSADGVTYDSSAPIKLNEIFSETYPGRHFYNWVSETTREPSANARIVVRAGTYTNFSSKFTLRGIRFNAPVAGDVWVPGTIGEMRWTSAGIADSSEGDVYVSTMGNIPSAFTNKVNTLRVTINDGITSWNIPSEIEPTTNAVAKVVITVAADKPDDIGITAYSLPFTLKGVMITSPTNGTKWVLGGSVDIQWKSAAAGGSVGIYYSSDNGTNYELITAAYPSPDGYNNYTWNVGTTRIPSPNARIKIVSVGGSSSISPPFTMNGLKVTEPSRQSVFAQSSIVNWIRWAATGDDGPYTLSWSTNGTSFTYFQTVTGAKEYNWATIPSSAISTSVQIRVAGTTYVNASEIFTIVLNPDVFLISPAQGDFWGAGLVHAVKWLRAGIMTTDFKVWYSLKPYVSSNEITTSITYDDASQMYTMLWPVPDQLTQAKITVTHNTDTNVADVSGEFNICGRFIVSDINSGRDPFARQPVSVTWRTVGSVPFVDVYYSITPPYQAASWNKINSLPIPNKYRVDLTPEPTDWSWSIFDLYLPGTPIMTTAARFRVQEAQYTNKFDTENLPAGTERPCAESSALTIRYYGIYWDVVDSTSTNSLDNLAVIDTSGWSESGLSCIFPNKILHYYPYGTWSTVWYKEYYFDEVVMYWNSENTALGSPNAWTQHVRMVRSQIQPEYRVLANFSYEPTNRVFTVSAWMERGGSIIDTPNQCIITIYDSAGNEEQKLDSTTTGSLLGTGVFWINWDASMLPEGSVHFAKVAIKFSGNWYSSGLMFTLRVPVGQEISGMIAGVSNAVTNVSAAIASNELLAADFRASAGSKLDFITNRLDIVNSLTNLPDMVQALSNSMAGLEGLTNLTSISDGLSNIWHSVSNLPSMAAAVDMSVAKIVTPATTIRVGTTNAFIYRTRSGYGNTKITVTDRAGTPRVNNQDMPEIVGTGIYRYEVWFDPAWGLGEFAVACRDSAAADAPHDQIAVLVVTEDYWTDKAALGVMTGQLARVEFNVSNIWNSLSGVDLNAGFSNMIAAVSNMQSTIATADLTNRTLLAMSVDVSNIWNGVSNLSSLSNLVALANLNLAGARADVSNVMANVAGLPAMGIAVSNMSRDVESLASLSNLTALASLDLSGLKNDLTNIVASVSSLSSLSNLTALANIDFAGIRTDVSNVMANVAGMPALGSTMSNVFNNTSSLSNLMALANLNLAGVQTDVSNVMANVAGLPAMGATVSNMASDVSSLASLSNITALASLDLTGLRIDLSNIVTEVTSLSSLTNLTALANLNLAGVRTDLSNVMATVSGVPAMGSTVSNMASGVASLSTLTNLTALASIDLGGVRRDLSNVMANVASVPGMGLTVSNIATGVSNLSTLTNLTALASLDFAGVRTDVSNMVAYVRGVPAIGSTVSNIFNNTSSLSNLMALASLNLAGVRSDVSNVATGVTSLLPLTNLTALASLDLAGVRSDVSNMMAYVQGVPEIGSTVSNIFNNTSSLSNLMALANLDLAGVRSDVSNVMANVAGVPGIGSTVSNIAVGVSNLSTLTNLTALASLDFAGIRADVSNVIAYVEGMPAMGSTVSNIFASTASISNLMALASIDMAGVRIDVSNMMSSVAGVASIGSTVSNIFDNTSSLSNLMILAGIDLAGVRSDVSNMMAYVEGVPAMGSTVSNIFAASQLSLTNLYALRVLTNLNLARLESDLAFTTNRIGSINWADIGQIKTLVADIDWADIGQIQSLIAGIDWTTMDTISKNVEDLRSYTDASFSSLDTQLGAMGQLASAVDAMSGDVSSASASAAEAAKQAKMAKTAISTIQGSISALKQTMGKGDKDGALSMMQSIVSKLDSLQSSTGQPPNLQPVIERLEVLAKGINLLAQKKDLDPLVTLPADLRAHSEMTRENVVLVNNKIEEMRAMIGALNDMVDKMANAPVVTEWLEAE